MNKFFVVVMAVVVALLVALYVFIPSNIVISKAILIPGKREAVYRVLADSNYWLKQPIVAGAGINIGFADLTYTGVTTKFTSAKNILDSSFLSVYAKNADSVVLSWQARIDASLNPIQRVQQYWFAKSVKRTMDNRLAVLESSLTSPEILYGIQIAPARVIDSLLVFKQDSTNGYPQTSVIYKMIDQLKVYVEKEKATVTNFPMVNISTKDSNTYFLKVALPVDRKLSGNGDVNYRWMLGGGNILVTEVKGGTNKIADAFEAISFYASDYNRVAPAIPYQQLITDRRAEPDTSKWITKVYFPVM